MQKGMLENPSIEQLHFQRNPCAFSTNSVPLVPERPVSEVDLYPPSSPSPLRFTFYASFLLSERKQFETIVDARVMVMVLELGAPEKEDISIFNFLRTHLLTNIFSCQLNVLFTSCFGRAVKFFHTAKKVLFLLFLFFIE